jgi:hypothetical protein
MNLVEMVGVDLCGDKEQARRKVETFQGRATQYPRKSARSVGAFDLTSICVVKVLDRGTDPAHRTFPCISRHIERHLSQIHES